MNLKDTYNKIAEEWYEDHKNDQWSYEGMHAFVNLLPTHGRVLNVGCGPGLEAAFLAEHGLSVYGFDISDRMVALARLHVPSAHFETMDISDVSTITESFDGVCMRAVLLHVPKVDAKKTIENVASKLRGEGHLYLTVKEMRIDGPEEELKTENDYGYEYTRFFSYFTQEEIESYLKDAGLELVYKNITPSGKTNWIQVIGQKI